MEFNLFVATPGDKQFLADLFREVRAPEFAPLGLPASALEELLEMQFRAQNAGYAQQFPDTDDQIIWVGDERAGRILIHRNVDHLILVDIALLSKFRREGIGTKLVLALIAEADAKNIPMRLTVRSDNPAELLYRRLGLERIGGDGLNFTMEWQRSGRNLAEHSEENSVQAFTVPIEHGLNSGYFRSLVGQTLTARSETLGDLPLVLQTVQSLRSAGHARNAGVDFGDSFELIFTGPIAPILPNAMTEIQPGTAAPLAVFLTPVGLKDGRVEYQAIFNRAAL